MSLSISERPIGFFLYSKNGEYKREYFGSNIQSELQSHYNLRSNETDKIYLVYLETYHREGRPDFQREILKRTTRQNIQNGKLSYRDTVDLNLDIDIDDDVEYLNSITKNLTERALSN